MQSQFGKSSEQDFYKCGFNDIIADNGIIINRRAMEACTHPDDGFTNVIMVVTV